MLRKIKALPLIIALLLFVDLTLFSQTIDSVSFRMNTRFSFYSFEKKGEMLFLVPQNLIFSRISLHLKISDKEIGSWEGLPGKKVIRIPINIDLQPSEYKVYADISVSGRTTRFRASSTLLMLTYKPNEVKTDRLTGGLIVNRMQFFPFGFYTYSPVYKTLPEEEVVKGFNMISPYQKILPENFSQRKEYMDRCAQLGMKVHYNLLSVSGGGGVGSLIEGLSDHDKISRLTNEVRCFMDHPALLAWYIADEPTGNKISPDSLIKIYNLVRKIDPWHPVSIVFMAPFMSSRQYADALDIVMADPYPVPDSPVSMVGDITGRLADEFAGRRPVWIVPQAFGGGEWWKREPTLQEIRSMTYQAIIKGARGIQFFVRQGLNYFPKSTASWGECGRMAAEIAEMTPWLLSDEDPVPVRSSGSEVLVRSALHDGKLMVLAVNKNNSPVRADFFISRAVTGRIRVLFENRFININGGNFTDILPSFGSQVYLITLQNERERIIPWAVNLLPDPGFEDLSSPGIPSACYARNGGDRGATYFLDTRDHIEGNHSLRINTPRENQSVKLRFFPIKGRNGSSYYLSIWAKGSLEQDLGETRDSRKLYFELALGDFGSTCFELTAEWKEYVTIVTIPYFSDQPARTNVILQLPSEGVAWFDMLQASEAVDINRSINPQLSINEF